MNRLTLVLISQCSNRRDISLQCNDVVIRVVDFVIESCEIFDGGVDIGVELVVLVFVAENFILE